MADARTWPCDPNNHIPIPHEALPFEFEREGPSWFTCSNGLLLLRCACGVILGSPTRHSIEADGTVNASIVCSYVSGGRQPCGWHVFGRLLDWTGGAMAAGAEKFVKVPE